MKKLSSIILSFLLLMMLTTISCSNSDIEICNNGIDDDGDGQVDCVDDDCLNDSNCLNQGSDMRLKQNIADLTYGLEEIMKLHAVSYEYKSDKDVSRLGLVAQEVFDVIPDVILIDDTKNQMMQIRYIDLVAVLVNAVQQQQTLIEENRQLILEVKNLQEQLTTTAIN